jgi:hypothetical protein
MHLEYETNKFSDRIKKQQAYEVVTKVKRTDKDQHGDTLKDLTFYSVTTPQIARRILLSA